MALYLVKSEMLKSQAKRERSQLGRRRKYLLGYLLRLNVLRLRLNAVLGYLREHEPRLKKRARARRRAEERDDEDNDPWDGYPWNA